MVEELEQNFYGLLNRLYIAVTEDNSIDPDYNFLCTTEDGVPIRKLFVSNLAERTTYKDLTALFSVYGNVESCYLMRSQGKTNYAFVTFSDVNDALRARIDGSRKKIRVHERDLRVMPANSWHQPDNMENMYYSHNKKGEDKGSKEPVTQDFLGDDNIDSPTHILNDDCLMHIFLHLPIADRVRIERVCKRWRAVSQESWSSVRRLDLSSFTWGFPPTSDRSCISTITLRKVLLRCGRFLTHLDISEISHRLQQSTLTIIGKMCPNLQSIDVTALNISASGIISLASNCHDIVRLSLGPSTYASDSDLIKLFLVNGKLKYLRVVTNVMTGKCLQYLPSTIEEICLERCNTIHAYQLANALDKFKNLKSLSLHKCVSILGSVIVAAGKHSATLKALELSGSFPLVTKIDMFHITSLVNLEVLKIGENPEITDEFLESLASKCKLLTYLDISRCTFVTDAGLSAVTSLPKLETLIMNDIRACGEAFNRMPNLKNLECRNCKNFLDDGVCTLIHDSPQLELLDLSGCINICNVTLEVAAAITNSRRKNCLLKIYIGGTSIDLTKFSNVSPFLQVVNVDLSVRGKSEMEDGLAHGPSSLVNVYQLVAGEWHEVAGLHT